MLPEDSFYRPLAVFTNGFVQLPWVLLSLQPNTYFTEDLNQLLEFPLTYGQKTPPVLGAYGMKNFFY